MELSLQQEAAVGAFHDWWNQTRQGVFYLAGYAGTGKSTILPYMVESTGLALEDVRFVAPTGKAARVMRTKLADQGLGAAECSTIHSFLYRPIENEIERIRKMIEEASDIRELNQLRNDLARLLRLKGSLAFTTKQVNPPKAIFVDEASMVGMRITQDLLELNIPLIAIGDPGQLPPVGDTPGLTLGDPDYFLTEIHRQALDNPIIALATHIREGHSIPYGDFGEVQVIRQRDDIDLFSGRQVLCGTHQKRWWVTEEIRRSKGYTPEDGPQQGEPLLVCKNSQSGYKWVNGAPAVAQSSHKTLTPGEDRFLLDVDCDEQSYKNVEVYQPLLEEHIAKRKGHMTIHPERAVDASKQCEHLDYGYVMTVHKSQGSQFEDPIVFDESVMFKHDAKRHAYTACTRAVSRLTWVQ